MNKKLTMLVVHGKKTSDDLTYMDVTALRWHRDASAFRQLEVPESSRMESVGDEITTLPIPQDWLVRDPYAETSLYTNEDDFGIPLRYVAAGTLKKIHLLSPIPRNLAILAYLREIERNTPVILYWHE